MQSRSLLSTLALLCLLFAGAKAEARPFRVSQVPNGSQANCLTCHTSGFGGVRNLFGAQVEASFLTVAGPAGSVVWGPALAALDSDGDGYTNGEELGDPSGAWRTGDPNPTLLIATLPGYASCASSAGTGAVCARCGGSADVTQNCPDPCGDSSTYAVAGEACDGTSLGGSTCLSEGFDGGTLACNASCSGLVTSGCTTLPAQVCGDGARTGTEACDGTSLGGATCVSEGFDGGTLACNASCSSLVTSGCTTLPAQVCGDGARTGTEACDGTSLGGATCVSEGFDGGTLACNASCSSLVTTGCTLCGDGVLDADESCDGSDLGGSTCLSEGFDGGTLACNASCSSLVTTGCITLPTDVCGDGARTGTEACDGPSLGGATCLSEGFDGGTLACNASCSSLVTTGCITLPTDVCGDGARTGTEACDGGDLNGGSCASQGFVDGTLGCNADCSLDTSGCSRCGDGVLDAEESCDGSVPASLDCSTESFVDGTLGCNADCSLDTSGCTLCGNGAMDAGEVCDGDDFGTTTCGSLGLGEGSLACLATCVIDTTACAVASADVCGDGVATGDEICDGADLLGLSCDAIGFASGELACTADCMLSSTDCVAAETDTSVDAGEDSTGDAISGEDSTGDAISGEDSTGDAISGEDSTGDAISGEDSSDDSGSDAATDTTPATKAKSDEGCSAAGGGSWSWLALLGLLAFARRRRA